MMSHRHEGFSILPETLTGLGSVGSTAQVDTVLIGQLVGAAYEGCTDCRDSRLDRLRSDTPTTVRLVELACRALRSQLDGLPWRAVEPAVPVPTSPDLCHIVVGFVPNECTLYEVVVRMDGDARRSTAATAVDIIVNDLTGGGALDGAWRPNTRPTPCCSSLAPAAPIAADRRRASGPRGPPAAGPPGRVVARQGGPRGGFFVGPPCPTICAPAGTVRAPASTGDV